MPKQRRLRKHIEEKNKALDQNLAPHILPTIKPTAKKLDEVADRWRRENPRHRTATPPLTMKTTSQIKRTKASLPARREDD
ncbi:hypothetical protein ISN44_As13g018280 [Arabidopsis suecica]|uniref:Uncharacterized protein n=1 Tax=Arabidopsis suecica TaxID=45249 RepID=A0A8T1XTQ2_ARASU|nr:hypothetical protein ISN44_As13g018280 [Arabidopsis suecica]